jgi:hypothetical protein
LTTRPKDAFDVISTSYANDLTAFFNAGEVINTQARLLIELIFFDPIAQLLYLHHRECLVTRYFPRFVVEEDPLCTIPIRNYHMVSAILLARLFDERANGKRKIFESSWHARRALGLRGTTGGYSFDNLVVSNAVGNYVYPIGFGNTKLDITKHPFGGSTAYHFCFDDAVALAIRMKPYIGGRFQRSATLGRYGRGDLSSIIVTNSSIEYRWKDVVYQSYPGSRFMTCPAINIRITRVPPGKPGDLTLTITGMNKALVDGGLPPPKTWNSSVVGKLRINHASQYETDVLVGGYTYAMNRRYRNAGFIGSLGSLIGSFGDNMSTYAPGLFHTQGRALSNLMIDYGSNFENIIQADQFAELINNIFLKTPQLFKAIFSPGDGLINLATRVKRLAELMTGSQLAYEFAAAPTIRALSALMDQVLDFRKGEGQFTLEGENFSSQPLSFQKAVLQASPSFYGLSSSNIRWFRVTFRTTVYSSMQASMVAKAILLNDPVAMIHGYPTPESIYNVQPLSFVVDWGFQVGPMIKANSAYFQSPSMPLRVGHTVHVEFKYSDGRIFNNFWRSEESDYPIDPPGESWLPLAVFPPIAIPFGIQQLFRFSESFRW